jgi:PBP1b-binding outer membrane lipoprotein LpoB
MKRISILIPVLAGAMLLTGCVTFPKGYSRSGSYDDSFSRSLSDGATQQVLWDADQEAAATNAQSAQDVRDAAAFAAEAAANLTVP